jgi:hypothetical protein
MQSAYFFNISATGRARFPAKPVKLMIANLDLRR